MIMVVNALLGDAKRGSGPLLNCERARARAQAGDWAATNPFANIFGENHPPSAQSSVAAFSALRRFGIGEETNNAFDDALLGDEGAARFPAHPQYGTSLIEDARLGYAEDPGDHIAELRPHLRDQRRRLFFMAPDSDDEDVNPWRLTVLHAGRFYTELLKPERLRNPSMTEEARTLIVRGLNRTLTGSLTRTTDALWLTQPSGVFLGQEVPLRVDQPIPWSGLGTTLALRAPAMPGRPPVLEVRMNGVEASLGELTLSPSMFEYLARVAGGALATSFSTECLQEVRTFRIRTVGVLEAALRARGQTPQLYAIDTAGERLQPIPLDLLNAEA